MNGMDQALGILGEMGKPSPGLPVYPARTVSKPGQRLRLIKGQNQIEQFPRILPSAADY
jgi:hypothetical protein